MDHASGSASVERKESYRGNDYDKDDRRNYGDKDRYERSRSASGGRRSPPVRRSKSPSLDNRGNVLYVGNLSRRLNEEEVKERFEKYGKIESIEMIKDPSTGECRGFAFVQFEDSKDARDAMEALDQKEFDGRKMKVEVSKRGRGYRKTPGEYLGHFRSRYNNNGGGRRRSPSPYSRRRPSRGGPRRSRSPRDNRDRYSGRRYSRSRSPGERRSRGGYGYNDRRSRSNDRYRNDRNDRNDRYRYRDGERSRSRGRD